jgi:hypothetical protein
MEFQSPPLWGRCLRSRQRGVLATNLMVHPPLSLRDISPTRGEIDPLSEAR